MIRYALTGDMLDTLSRSWWVVVLRGSAVALLGLVAVVWVQGLPEAAALVTLAVVFGVLALADGLALAWVALRSAAGTRASLVVQAVLSVLLGLLAVAVPLLVGIALIYVVGAWAIVTGIAEIITAVRLRAHISSEWLLIFAGSLSVIFGLLLWFWPLEAARAVIFVVGVYAVIFGVVLAVAGVRLRGAADTFAAHDTEGTDAYEDLGEGPGEYGGPAEETAPEGEEGLGHRGPSRRRGRHRAPKDDEH